MLALLLGYPLAYAIAQKAGRWKNLLLVCVVAPMFTSFLVRTLAWKTILSDNGALVGLLRDVHLLGPDGRLLATPIAVVLGLTYNFLPFLVLPLYASLERLDHRLLEAAQRPVRQPGAGVPPGHAAAVDARPGRRHAAVLHPGQPATTSTPNCSAPRTST